MKPPVVLLHALIMVLTPIPIAVAAAPSDIDRIPFAATSASPTPDEVRNDLGPPDATLGALVWIYWRRGPYRDNPELDTLVIAFRGGRVYEVKQTNGVVIRRLLAQAEARNAKAGAGKQPVARR